MSAKPIKKLGVVVGPQKPEAAAVVSDLHAWCEARDISFFAAGEIAAKLGCAALGEAESELPSELDMLVVLGGDGTMLGAARLVGAQQIPVLGVNFGWLGYLTEFTLTELFSSLDGVREGRFSLDRRMLLDIHLSRE